MSKKLFPFFIVICTLLIFTSCKQETSDDVIKVGQFTSLTGSEATFGISSDNGLKLAVEEVNQSGGVLGKKIELITADNQGKTNETITVVEKLINRDKVIAIIGEVASSRSIAAAPICEKYKIPMISPASTNPEVTAIGEYIFRVCFIDPFQATVMSKFALNSMKIKKIAVLIDQKNAYSTGLADNFQRVFKEMGGVITAVQKYSAGDKDFKAQLTDIKNSNPEAIFIPGYYTDVNLISIQARDLGITVPLLGGDGWESPQLLDGKAKDALEGCFFSTHVSIEDPNPKVQNFIAKYKEKYGETPDAMALLSYDAGHILFEAIKKAGSTNNEAIRDALAKTVDFAGVTGSITINEQRNAVKPAVVMMVHDGKFTYKETIAP
ncbi:MAG: ethanolamine utilization protein EutJ [Ignavibacteriales bacterium UTCHB1]|jgi:amino acid/amide ABC transporter substrate-binding protein, HAAT family (TC 3.A.1.4.-)|nr:ABC transporter substrate-binding protein [Ignavibacteria bacterium]OQY77373.1 MAG: ethanolamine utilization protein EutJ [Ignavibacteriales bacterium UTCHB1]